MRSVLILIVGILGFSAPVWGQEKQIKRADEYYKNGKYASAIPLYEEALTFKNNLSASTKLAFCYRMNNKLGKAEQLYAKIVGDKNARNNTLLYYGEALMSNGKYDEAKIWLEKYKQLEPDDPNADLMLRSCAEVSKISPFYSRILIEPFPHNADADDNSPVFWNGGIVFSSDRGVGIHFLKEKSGWTGRDYIRLYYSKEMEGGGFEPPGELSDKLNVVNKNNGNASFSGDSTEIFFTRNSNELSKTNAFNLQLYSAKYENSGRWKDVEILPFCLNEINYMHPAISPKGAELFFVSDKAGGIGGTDLYSVKRLPDGSWTKPESLGAVVNTTANEGFPFMDAENRLFFCSKGHPGYGGFDIFMTKRDAQGNWAKPVNLGGPINSPLDDISICIEKTGKRGLFTSGRDGGDDDIYLFYLNDNLPVAEPAVPEPVLVKEEKIEMPATMESEMHVPPTVEMSEPEPASQQLPKEPELLPAPIDSSQKEQPKMQQVEAETAVTQPFQTTSFIEPPQKTVEPITGANLFIFSDFQGLALQKGLEIGQRFIIENVKFGLEEYRITAEMGKELDRLVPVLAQFPTVKIEISGHTELRGDEKNNLTLSRYRAEGVANYLIQRGVFSGRLTAKGYGKTLPALPCATETDCDDARHAANQRIEIKIVAL